MRVQCTGQVLRIEIEMPDGKVWPFAFNALAAAELERIHPVALDAVQRAKKERDTTAGVGLFYDMLAAGVRAGLIMDRRSERFEVQDAYAIPLSEDLIEAITAALEAFQGADPTQARPAQPNRAQRRAAGRKRRRG